MAKAQRRGGLGLMLLILAAVLAALLLSQQAAAARIGGAVAGIWISVMSVVLRLIGAIFGH